MAKLKNPGGHPWILMTRVDMRRWRLWVALTCLSVAAVLLPKAFAG